MGEFWEESFRDKREMWGFTPTKSAQLTAEFFFGEGIREVLIPGIGYGRNAQAFLDSGMAVSGIEISETAIEMAKKHYGTQLYIHHGSVLDMPFDGRLYRGIFAHGLIHLLDEDERRKFINNCERQLANDGYMVFTAITEQAPTYGQGTLIGKNRYEQFGGVKLFFYNRAAIEKEFGHMGLVEVLTIDENHPFYLIKCKKA